MSFDEKKRGFKFGVEDDVGSSFLHEDFDEMEEITVLELEELADALRFLLELEPHTCPRRGVDIPCILCEDPCSSANYQEVESKLGKGRRTINSSTISLKFEILHPATIFVEGISLKILVTLTQ